MKKFVPLLLAAIVALSIAACEESKTTCKQFCLMIISDALPIQFWLNGQESYNQSIEHEEFVDEVCFHQEIKCTEEQHVQFQTPYDNSDYSLKAYDKDNVEVMDLPFTTIEPEIIENGDFSDGLNDWTQVTFLPGINSVRAWTASGGGAEVNLLAGTLVNNSSRMLQQLGGIDPTKSYLVNINSFINAASNVAADVELQMLFLDDLGNIVDYVVLHTFNQSIDTYDVVDYSLLPADLVGVSGIGFAFNTITACAEACAVSLDNISVRTIGDNTQADLLFTPSVEGLCDKLIRFEIWNTTADVMLAFTDDLLISTEPQTSILMNYKSSKNYAGLIYTSTSPYFTLRIPARFYHWRNSTEVEAEELSNSVIIDVAFTLKKQRLLTVGHMPEYMHTKIQLALAHAIAGSVLIKGYEWIMEEGYELIDVKAPEFPLKAANVYLTRRNYVSRNVM